MDEQYFGVEILAIQLLCKDKWHLGVQTLGFNEICFPENLLKLFFVCDISDTKCHESWKKKQLKNSLDITELTLCLPSSTNFIALQLCGEPSFCVVLCFNVTVVHSLKLGRNHVMV